MIRACGIALGSTAALALLLLLVQDWAERRKRNECVRKAIARMERRS